MRRQLRLFFIALQFLTRVPAPRWVGFEPDWLNASARYFSLVGVCIGLCAAAVLWAAAWLFPPSVGAWLSIVATLLLTGAFHEDGLADTCDALGGVVSRERSLEIMKDSRIGTYGAVALVVTLALKATTLAALPWAWAALASVAAHTFSRVAPVLLIRWLPYAGDVDAAKAKPLARRVRAVDVGVNLACAFGVAVLIAWLAPASRWSLVFGGAAILVVAGAARRWLRWRLGGYTGDTLGATQQVTELAILLVWLAVMRAPP